jgi:hypothetical protein
MAEEDPPFPPPEGYRFVREWGGGHCMFQAIARQLWGNPNDYQRLRNELGEHYRWINDEEDRVGALFEYHREDIYDALRNYLPYRNPPEQPEADEYRQAVQRINAHNSSAENRGQAQRIRNDLRRPYQIRPEDLPDLITLQLYTYFIQLRDYIGGAMDLIALAQRFNLHIRVWGLGQRGNIYQVDYGRPENPNKIYLMFSGNHYDTLEPIAGGGKRKKIRKTKKTKK